MSQEEGDKPRDFFTELVNAGICGLITDDPGYYKGRHEQYLISRGLST
ncbi:MAG: hypothetical protein ACK481_01005 [Candidatus Melainabacteria bacterium]|jgi:hypothetical protein